MFATPAFAQTAAGAGSSGNPFDLLLSSGSPVPMFLMMGVLFYFLLWRPQQKRLKDHKNMVAALKRGDTVVLNSGVIGKVSRVDETEVSLDIAQGVTIKVVRTMISEVRARSEPVPANESKS